MLAQVNFEDGGNRNTQRKPSKSDGELLRVIVHTMIVEFGGLINEQYKPLPSKEYSKGFFPEGPGLHPLINPIQQSLTYLVIRWELVCHFDTTHTPIIFSR